MYKPYLLFFCFLCIESIVVQDKYSIKTNINKYSNLLLCCLVIVFFWGFRGYVITDWVNYYGHFVMLPSSFRVLLEKNGFLELGYNTLQFIVKKIWNNYFFLQIICSLIDFIIFYKAIVELDYKNIPIIFLSFIIFKGIVIEFNLLRNSKSIFLFLYSLKFIKKEKSFIKYVLTNLIGAMFHISALLFIPLYFFIGRRIKDYIVLVVCLFSISFMILRISISAGLVSGICNVLPNGATVEKLSKYLIGQSSSVFSFIYIERLLSLALFWSYRNKLIKSNENNVIMLNLFYFYFCICFIFWDFFLIIQRIALLFICSNWFLFPELLKTIKNKEAKMLFFVIFFAYGAAKVYKDATADPANRYVLNFNEVSYDEKCAEYYKIPAHRAFNNKE